MTAEKRAVFYGWRNVMFMFVSYGCLYATILYGFGVIFPRDQHRTAQRNNDSIHAGTNSFMWVIDTARKNHRSS